MKTYLKTIARLRECQREATVRRLFPRIHAPWPVTTPPIATPVKGPRALYCARRVLCRPAPKRGRNGGMNALQGLFRKRSAVRRRSFSGSTSSVSSSVWRETPPAGPRSSSARSKIGSSRRGWCRCGSISATTPASPTAFRRTPIITSRSGWPESWPESWPEREWGGRRPRSVSPQTGITASGQRGGGGWQPPRCWPRRMPSRPVCCRPRSEPGRLPPPVTTISRSGSCEPRRRTTPRPAARGATRPRSKFACVAVMANFS